MRGSSWIKLMVYFFVLVSWRACCDCVYSTMKCRLTNRSLRNFEFEYVSFEKPHDIIFNDLF